MDHAGIEPPTFTNGEVEMGEVLKWPRAPRPNEDVIATLEAALDAARAGTAPAVLVMIMNPLGEIEARLVGDLGHRATFIRNFYLEAKRIFAYR